MASTSVRRVQKVRSPVPVAVAPARSLPRPERLTRALRPRLTVRPPFLLQELKDVHAAADLKDLTVEPEEDNLLRWNVVMAGPVRRPSS